MILALLFLFERSLFAMPLPDLPPMNQITCSVSLQAQAGQIREEKMVFGKPVHEDRFANATGQYINPNEFGHHELKPHVEAITGVYIGVGSFRVLNGAAMTKCEEIIQMDADLATTSFNRLNRELLKAATDRFEYLSYLFTGSLQEELLAAVRSDQLPEREFVKALMAVPRVKRGNEKFRPFVAGELKFALDYARQISKWSSDTDYEGRALSAPLHVLDLFAQVGVTVTSSVNYISHFLRSEPIWKETIFGNSAYFHKIKKMAHAGKIYILVGDLAGERTMPELAWAMRDTRRQAGVIDVSNAHDWITLTRDAPEPDASVFPGFAEAFRFLRDNHNIVPRAVDDHTGRWQKQPKVRKEAYYANLERFPWNPEGRLLTFGGYRSIPAEPWPMTLISPNQINALSKTRERPSGETPLDQMVIEQKKGKKASDTLYLLP